MKTFIYITTFKNASYGQNVTNKVYQIKNNIPILLGERRYNTGSFRGHEHEAMQVIIDSKALPKKFMDHPKHGYIDRDKSHLYRLVELRP